MSGAQTAETLVEDKLRCLIEDPEMGITERGVMVQALHEIEAFRALLDEVYETQYCLDLHRRIKTALGKPE